MANTKSAKKAVRSQATKKKYNDRAKTGYKEARKALLDEVAKGDLKKARENLSKAYKKIDKAAKTRAIHPNAAARYKSRLAKKLSK